MHNIIGSGSLAIFLGGVVAFLAFVPFVAVSYRRRGRLSFGRTLLWAGAAVYFWAIWTYTLVPMPDSDAYRCAGRNLRPFQFVDEIRDAVAVSGRYLTDPVVLQVALNVLLFVPLGFFLRVLGGRGIVVAGLVGLAISGIIETTQLTGVWGVFPCAYRVFDVDDLIANTSGALLGSLVAFAVPRKHRGLEKSPDAEIPVPSRAAAGCSASCATWSASDCSARASRWRCRRRWSSCSTTRDARVTSPRRWARASAPPCGSS